MGGAGTWPHQLAQAFSQVEQRTAESLSNGTKTPAARSGTLIGRMILADTTTDTLGFAGRLGADVGLNSAWVMVAAVLVMFMQAGFAMLEIGFVRGKNAGSVVAKILVNFALAALGFWAIGFALAFGGDGALLGTHGWFLAHARAFPL